VEGDDDAGILDMGFHDFLHGMSVRKMQGRRSVERVARDLQAQEKEKNLDRLQVMIFDHDNFPSDLTSTEMVKVLQWDRYCLENYLLDAHVLSALLEDKMSKPPSAGAINSRLEELSSALLRKRVAMHVYQMEFEIQNSGWRKRHAAESFKDIAAKLRETLRSTVKSATRFNDETFEDDFVEKCEREFQKQKTTWDWRCQANGKELLNSLLTSFTVSVPRDVFKKDIMRQMRADRTNDWMKLADFLAKHLKSH
jgi:hypothetical protein